MQWENAPNAGFSSAHPSSLYLPIIDSDAFGPQRVNVADQVSNPASLWHTLRRMIALRKTHSAFGWGSFAWAEGVVESVAAYWREYGDQRLLVLNNLSASDQFVKLALPAGFYPDPFDLFTGLRHPLSAAGHLELSLGPFEYRWFSFDALPSQA
jgi:maltose alpha-D-glucosyltransferase/alpha-amylase